MANMEAISLEKLNSNLLALRELVERMSEVILEDNMELSDEVVVEIERSQNAPKCDFISQEDIEAEFLQ